VPMTRSALARHREEGGAWWETAISRVEPNRIEIRGYPIEELIGRLSYAEMLALLVLGQRLEPAKAALLDAALVAGADHGPRAPSIAAARMAATCGISFNSAVATGINVLGDHHGGAVEQFMYVVSDVHDGASAYELVASYRSEGRAVPGYGHQLHDRDPRRQPLLDLIERAHDRGTLAGKYLDAAREVERELEAAVTRAIPMNIDGLSGVIYLELGFPAAVAKGLFSLSRGMGIVAHALEELQTGSVIKGPCPPGEDLVRYTGHEERSLLGPARRHSAVDDEFWSTLGEGGVCVYWGADLDQFNLLDAEVRARLVSFTIDSSWQPEPKRAESVTAILELPKAERLAALRELAGA
jgi:citrate synthase